MSDNKTEEFNLQPMNQDPFKMESITKEKLLEDLEKCKIASDIKNEFNAHVLAIELQAKIMGYVS